MGSFARAIGVVTVFMFLAVSTAVAVERDPLPPRVPPDKIKAARKLKNPVPKTSENLAKGKALFESKGTCFNCHGKAGKGDGPAGKILNPTPRNFTNCKFHKKRKDGELFWVIKNGSAGTGMVPLIGKVINEEEAWTIINYERSFCETSKEAKILAEIKK